jgi:hypothetical protein
MDMNGETKKTPPVLDLRDLVREVLASAREESAQKGASQAKSESQRQPNQP